MFELEMYVIDNIVVQNLNQTLKVILLRFKTSDISLKPHLDRLLFVSNN